MTIKQLFVDAEMDKQPFVLCQSVRDCGDYAGPWSVTDDVLSGKWFLEWQRDRYRWIGHRMRVIGRDKRIG